MWVKSDKEEYRAGDEVTFEIGMDFGRMVKAQGLYATLICMERKKIISEGEREETGEHFRQEKQLAGEGNFMDQVYKVTFVLPENAPSTSHEFGHDNKISEWKLFVKLDIPFAPDQNAEMEINVAGLGE